MAGIDDIDCSTFFDHIDDLLDIPDETCTNSNSSSSKLESGFFFGDFKDFPSIWTHSDAFPEPTKSLFSENHSSLSDDLNVPYEDIAELDWLSNFLDDSSAGDSLTIDQNTEHKKKKRIISIPEEFDQSDDDLNHSTKLSGEVRKCQHCEITKTPQWRAGPNGPKTLCNACGVRYKSGRLFPEYRPAASPTFVPSIHSNSHKKVLEMRVKDSHTE